MKLTIGEIAAACQGALVGKKPGPARAPQGEGAVATGVSWDSRTVRPGDLYVALPGERADGHDFAQAAVDAGAVAVLATRPLGVGVPVIVVNDCQLALAQLASFWRDRLYSTVIGLTGSSGKTSTKNLIRDVLSARMRVCATAANQNNELGVPNTVLSANDESVVVVEMGMRGQGEIRELCHVAWPEWGLVTNVGVSHIELLGSRDNIARAKAELFDELPWYGLAFVNAADEYASKLVEYGKLADRGIPIVYFDGMSGARPALVDEDVYQPFVWATEVTLDDEGRPSFTLNAKDVPCVNADGAACDEPLWVTEGEVRCSLQLRGRHSVSNACAAAAVGMCCGMSLDEVAEALAAALPESGRQQVVQAAGGFTVIDDAYNANPDSMGASLAMFKEMVVPGRRIAVLGDMLELGGFARDGHERMGALAARAGVDVLVCVGGLSRDMARAARGAGMADGAVHEVPDAATALATVAPLLQPGDAVLVKASHSIGLSHVVEGLVG